ncbi:ABC transporter permease [Mangrovicoccus sp. HB161399]|uniref:ABC transporter permease n=1 Tax=Mangrovicoccus sp. HB161399 TaxID=2720392 RepID=UPI001C130026|nr:ABC transporter permease [Mangrovicoccus sp. HB161399]
MTETSTMVPHVPAAGGRRLPAPRILLRTGALCLVTAMVYVFLYLPIIHIGLGSASRNTNFPYPPHWAFKAYADLFANALYRTALGNSILLGLGSAVLTVTMSTMAMIGVLRFAGRHARIFILLFVAPLFVAEVLVGISSLVLSGLFLGLPGNLFSAMLANSVHCFAYALLIMATQLYRYDWRLDEAAMVFGATPAQTFWLVTLPLIWPGLLGAFLISFILSFNNLEISFYLLGATPTLPSVAWGALRYGVKPELFALATLVNLTVLAGLAGMYVAMARGWAKFGHRPERGAAVG